jgi:PAS domain S-box-containing protein
MSELLRTLILENRASDAKLVVRELERAGFDPKWKRVETEAQYVSQLEASPEVILADYTMPKFGAMRALEVLQKKGLDIPFIIVSGSIGEDIAVEAMRHGAADYLRKDRLGRLGPAVNNALEQSRSRKESKRAAVELHSTHEQLRHLLAHSPAVIYSLKIEDHRVTPTVVSDNIERLLGVRVEESTHEWWLESLHPDDRERVLNTVSESLSGDGYWMEYRIRHKDGSYHWVEDNNRVVRDALGEATDAVGVWTDITERKQAEERLREQADIINRAHDAIIILNFKDQRIVFWNSGAERLYGWSAGDAIGRSIGELIFADAKDCEGPLKVLLASAGEFHGEVKQVAKNGRKIIVDSRATLIRNQDGTPRSVLLINTDITEQKKLETHLLRAQRLESIGTLASGVAHDLNNILTPILMCAEMLKDDPMGEEIPALISMIEESAKRGANVVKQVFTFARGIEGERVAIKPSHLIQEMIDIAKNTFPKTIEILSRYPDDLWSIKCDPTQLHQVLLNLSVNARDAMPNGGSLTIGTDNFDVDKHYASMIPGAKPGPHVMFRVIDTGAGMSRATIDKIFTPFFTTKKIGQGTGLGLSTVLGIVKSHGGFISVDSEVGRGTTFKVFLPAKRDDETVQGIEAPVESPPGNGELILVVDDEDNISRVTKMILENNNYSVLCASDGPDAIAIYAKQMDSIKVVLTDIILPYMDGVSLIRAFKKMKPDMLFVASTGYGEPAHLAELQALNVTNLLNKPYDTQQLLKTLHDVLEHKQIAGSSRS